METSLGVLAIVVVGLMVGVEFSVAAFVNPIFDRLPNNGGLAARIDGAQLLGRVMPFWYFGSLGLSVAWIVVSWGASSTWLIGIAAALLVASVIISLALLVPMNDRTRAWTPETAPADWRQQAGRWDRLHVVRVGMIVAAFALLAVAGLVH